MSTYDIIYKDVAYIFNDSIELLNKLDEFRINNVSHLNRFYLTERYFLDIDVLSKARDITNHYKGVNKIEEYRRKNEDEINFMSMLSEFTISNYFYNLFERYNREQKSFYEHINYELASVVDIKLNKFNLDYKIKLNNEELNFDLKSAFYEKGKINVNQKAFNRIEKKLNSFILVALLNGNFENRETIEFIDYFIVNKDYFKQKSKLIENKAPFYSFEINDDFLVLGV